MSTLLGADDDPAYLDGHGVIDADTARSLLADARRSFISPTRPATDGPGLTYTASPKLQELVRSGELCCTFPGCNNPVWQADLDHTRPFDPDDPSAGGRTTRCNLKPLCRFHHRIKTFAGWRDYQDEYQSVWFQSPTGHLFLGNAFNGRDLFEKLIPERPPDHPARQEIHDLDAAAQRRDQRAKDRWNEANPPPF